MATITRFEDIESWKEARKLTADLYKLCRSTPLATDYGLCDQLRRAGVSIMANIAEGFGRGGNKEFVQFLSNSKGSVAELRSHLHVLLDAEYIKPSEFQILYDQAVYIDVLLGRFMNYLLNSDLKGRKFKQAN
jgi:four helix bundle protein